MKRSPPRASGPETRSTPPILTRNGAILGALGLVAIVAGFFLLSQGSITAAPLLLVAGYAVFLPLAILR